MRIVIRTDASSQIGIGHVMRCLTLADELQQMGCEVSFICRQLDGDMNRYITEKGLRVDIIDQSYTEQDADYNWKSDAISTVNIMERYGCIDWLIVDHYMLDHEWEGYIKDSVNSIMVIDDLANRSHSCDLLLDQNHYVDLEHRYDNLVSDTCNKLLGPQHVLLRKEFREMSQNQRVRDGSIKRILIFMGGGDTENITSKTIQAIFKLNRSNIIVDVVVGSSNKLKDEISHECDKLPNFNFHCQTEKMAELIYRADICIGAGGATTWERGMLGLPTITIVTADNQYRTTKDLSKMGATRYLGRSDKVTVLMIHDALEELVNDRNAVKELSSNIKKVLRHRADQVISTSAECIVNQTNKSQ